jgi:hypothetical protein
MVDPSRSIGFLIAAVAQGMLVVMNQHACNI